MTMKVQVFGLSELQNNLKKLTLEMRRGIKQELATTARVDVETVAKEMVPVDTGRLKNSIITVDNTNIFDLSVNVEARVNYAQHIHRIGGKMGKGKGYLIIPLEKAKPALMERIKRLVNK